MATCSSTRIGRTRCTGNGWPWRVPRRAPAGSAGPCGCRGRSSPTPRRIGSNRDPQVLGQVASQTRPEGASNARRTWVYVERCWRPRTKYGEANWPSTPLLLHRAEGESADDVALGEEGDHEHGERDQGGRGGQGAPVDLLVGDHGVDGDG